jgi:uncharacterized protein (TIGR01777 family)
MQPANINKTSVMITGGSGLVGRKLTSLLLSKGYNVSHLSRTEKSQTGIKVFKWDPDKKYIDPEALNGIQYLVHLAGANIGEKRWTNARKKEIIQSRVDSAKFLFDKIKNNPVSLKAFISASAIGYYGSVTSETVFNENDPSGNDFLGNTCRVWEEAADLFSGIGIRTVKIRTAVVLEKNDSALSKMIAPARFGFLVRTGSGQQYMPWIHIKDLCNIYLKAIEVSAMNDVYNAVAPEHINHNDFINTLAKTMHKAVFPMNVPSFILRIALGEMSDVVLKGSRVSSEKIIDARYKFIYPRLKVAMEIVLGKKGG